jgi:hypothetical protein
MVTLSSKSLAMVSKSKLAIKAIDTDTKLANFAVKISTQRCLEPKGTHTKVAVSLAIASM